MSRDGGGSAELPRYQQVADELMKRIGAGRYPVGALLPTEMELCTQYGVSRHTVREALRLLSDAGLISRRRRIGTEVVARTPAAAYRQPTNSIADFLQYAEASRVVVLRTRRVTSDAALAEMLECRPGDRWLRIESVRTMPGDARPICFTTAYVDAGLPGIEARLEQLSGPISAMLERVYGLHIARVDQTIEAVRIPKRLAAALYAELGGPALRATRRYYSEHGALIEHSSAVHPGDRFTYVTTLVRA
ncbi:MAG: GntR family transcriptional regulator [Gemmatimonadaceae bacterium]|nr:GntR family transcriptional regulator [Gemmatimonadaceae bacterium]